jgi:hypothetical protein
MYKYLAALLILSAVCGQANALPKSQMIRVVTAQGCTIYVHPAYAPKFSTFFRLLKDAGYRVPCNITNCWSGRGHVPGSNHYIGAACDIQTGWNRGPKFVYRMRSIVREAGLYDGCRFRDCGHVEAVRGTHNSAPGSVVVSARKRRSAAGYDPHFIGPDVQGGG